MCPAVYRLNYLNDRAFIYDRSVRAGQKTPSTGITFCSIDHCAAKCIRSDRITRASLCTGALVPQDIRALMADAFQRAQDVLARGLLMPKAHIFTKEILIANRLKPKRGTAGLCRIIQIGADFVACLIFRYCRHDTFGYIPEHRFLCIRIGKQRDLLKNDSAVLYLEGTLFIH